MRKVFYKRKDKELAFTLIGGLGNQLFIYFAGRYFSQKYKCVVRYTFRQLDENHPQFNSRITSFILNNEVEEKLQLKRKYTVTLVLRIINKLRARLNLVKIFKKVYSESEFNLKKEEAKLKLTLESLSTKTLPVYGFFQDFDYFKFGNNSIDFDLKSPSKWYIEMLAHARNSCPVMLHVRLGDYVVKDSKWGILDTEYYLKALELITKCLGPTHVWVFSDNFLVAKHILSEAVGLKISYIESSEGKDPAEILKLMTFGIGHVVSNSTFSFWSAYLAKESQIVIYPNPIMINQANQIRGVPENWIKQDSIWASFEKISNLKSDLF
jgi:hypothetical protein